VPIRLLGHILCESERCTQITVHVPKTLYKYRLDIGI